MKNLLFLIILCFGHNAFSQKSFLVKYKLKYKPSKDFD